VEISGFLSNLKAVGASPYAFAAYLAVVAAWVYTTIARHRLGKIAGIIKDLPKEDRTQLLLREYSTAPRAGLSPEQWIKSRQHTLLFFAFLSLVLCVTVVVIIALTAPPSGSRGERRGESTVLLGLLDGQNQRIRDLEGKLAALEAKASGVKESLGALSGVQKTPTYLAMLRDLSEQYDPTDSQAAAVLADLSLSPEDKAALLQMSLMKRLDHDIEDQVLRAEALRNSRLADEEVMKLKRLIDKRSQVFEALSQIIDRYNETAKRAIEKINR
jgi:hypothetical protein